MLVLIK